MGKIIQFPEHARTDSHVYKLKGVSDRLDEVFLDALDSDLDATELAGLAAHRLGTLLRHVEYKTKLWDVCEKVLRKQAGL